MSIEDLSVTNMTVTSAARKEQALSTVPGAVYVISNKQIRRSGARSVAEALALAPGIQVTKISEYNWQVSLRGLNEILFNKLLVMVDGRTVFSPLMSGTFWDTVDTLMADIERIEIIRGTAGTMWGGNAANGVVNIITKHSRDTQGSYLEVSAGEHEYREFNYRYGLTLSETTTARIYAKGVKSNYYTFNDDKWKSYNAGLRADYLNSNTQMTFEAGGYHNKSEHNWLVISYNKTLDSFHLSPYELDDYSRGGYISLDWAKQLSQTEYEISLWGDANSSVEPSSASEFYTLDIESLVRTELNSAHELTAGGGVRMIHRHTASYPNSSHTQLPLWGRISWDTNNSDYIYNHYLQLESRISDSITTTLGTKVEHFTLNNSTELQPQARIVYAHSKRHKFWAGIGRAVVTPSIVDSTTDHYLFKPTLQPVNEDTLGYYPLLKFTFGDENLKNESVVTLDMGHRYSPAASLYIGSTVFYSRYKHLRMMTDSFFYCRYGQCLDDSQVPGSLFIQSSHYTDQLNADSYGLELAVDWSPWKNLRLNTSYSFINTETKCQGSATCETDIFGGYPAKYKHQPNHLVSIHSQWDISPAWQLDLWFKYKSAVNSGVTFSDGNQPFDAPSVSTLDMRLAWHEKPNWPKIELVIDAIGEDSYEDQPGKAKIEETAYLRASWDFL
ncbi:TonB-dependent siderophore receptor [uncultured Photobacterium sp.]|uniref:TonB-dependent receptor plug domain-containing protein n=1 Tax=uncultured Photobacterium sp. TaxID=173973 RepID=UPI002607B92C|nr:TonB-dependent receptor plug domain-containing protein [uncultured Photobacterium sp.]